MKTRIVKEGGVRKQEFMEAAYVLFASVGYENTTINAIIESVGVSKGAFYHHFESKEDLLDSMVRIQVERVLTIVREVVSSTKLSAVEKFNLMIARIQAYRTKNMKMLYKLFEFYLNEDNIRYRYKLEQYTVERALQLYTVLIGQGIEEGSFHISNPDLVAEMIMRIIPQFRMKMAILFLETPQNPDNLLEIKRIAHFLEDALSQILGAEKGLIKVAGSFILLFTSPSET